MARADERRRPDWTDYLALALLGWILVLPLAALVWHNDRALFPDAVGRRAVDSAKLTRAVEGTSGNPHQFFQHLVNLGSPGAVACFALVLAVLAVRVRDWRGAVIAAVGTATAVVVTEHVLKPLVDRRLGGSLAFPSGHVTGASAVAAAAIILAERHARSRFPWLQAGVALALPLVVMVGVIRLRYHYTTDALGGLASGVAAVLTVAALVVSPLVTRCLRSGFARRLRRRLLERGLASR